MDLASPTPRLLAPGVGPTFLVCSELLTIKAVAADTGGAYTLFEVQTPPGRGMPPHRQRLDDETFFVLEGTYAFRIAERLVECGPGGYAFAPRGTPHAYANAGADLARMLILVSPGGIHEQFVADAGEPIGGPATSPGPADLGRVLAVAPKYGIEFAGTPGEHLGGAEVS